MTNNKSHTNSILKGYYRTFHLSKCNLQGCNNFISSLTPTPKRICNSHQKRERHLQLDLKGLKRIRDYSETKAPPRRQSQIERSEYKRI